VILSGKSLAKAREFFSFSLLAARAPGLASMPRPADIPLLGVRLPAIIAVPAPPPPVVVSFAGAHRPAGGAPRRLYTYRT
jgi:hypothetical protein